jgi:hypothetical protein
VRPAASTCAAGALGAIGKITRTGKFFPDMMLPRLLLDNV